MQAVATIGLDIAKSAFQVHGVDAAGQVLIRRQLKRLMKALARFVGAVPDHDHPIELHDLLLEAEQLIAELGKVSPDRIDHRGLLANKQMPCAVKHATRRKPRSQPDIPAVSGRTPGRRDGRPGKNGGDWPLPGEVVADVGVAVCGIVPQAPVKWKRLI
jgi:hypothetical protein